MAKTLCDWKKSDIKSNWHELIMITANPQYTCAKCARSAREKKVLCKAVKRPE